MTVQSFHIHRWFRNWLQIERSAVKLDTLDLQIDCGKVISGPLALHLSTLCL
jgi:hypothetical protein